jgi:DMSO/TMAO reductase YedYZ molybdopterin-dependent catalytic subunit
VRPLRAVSVLAPRDPAVGELGVPVNRTAGAAGIRSLATDPAWRLTVVGPDRSLTLSLAQLLALPQHEAVLPIACVEGWSATARWGGVRLRDVLDRAGVPPDAHVTASSLESNWLYATSAIGPSAARDPLSLLALRLNGATLTLDHGYPVRLIAPNRPGVQQTKWLSRIEVTS